MTQLKEWVFEKDYDRIRNLETGETIHCSELSMLDRYGCGGILCTGTGLSHYHITYHNPTNRQLNVSGGSPNQLISQTVYPGGMMSYEWKQWRKFITITTIRRT